MFKHSHTISFYVSSSFSPSLTTTGPLLSSLFHASFTLWLRNMVVVMLWWHNDIVNTLCGIIEKICQQ